MTLTVALWICCPIILALFMSITSASIQMKNEAIKEQRFWDDRLHRVGLNVVNIAGIGSRVDIGWPMNGVVNFIYWLEKRFF